MITLYGAQNWIQARTVAIEEFFYGTFEVAPVGGIPHRYVYKDDAEPHPLK